MDLAEATTTELPLKGMRPEARRKLRSAAGVGGALRDRCLELGYGNPCLTDLLLTLRKDEPWSDSLQLWLRTAGFGDREMGRGQVKRNTERSPASKPGCFVASSGERLSFSL